MIGHLAQRARMMQRWHTRFELEDWMRAQQQRIARELGTVETELDSTLQARRTYALERRGYTGGGGLPHGSPARGE